MQISKVLFFFFFVGVLSQDVYAQQYVDELRAGAITVTQGRMRKALETENALQTTISGGHMLIDAEMNEIKDFQKQFNDYLDTFHDILAASAEIYGMIYESNRFAENISDLQKAISDCPANLFAVAFSEGKNKLYVMIVGEASGIIGDLRKVMVGKLTEKERIKILSGIRPKLKKFNKLLRQMTMTIRYTSLMDVWRQIVKNAYKYEKRSKSEIIYECFDDWRYNVQKCKSIGNN